VIANPSPLSASGLRVEEYLKVLDSSVSSPNDLAEEPEKTPTSLQQAFEDFQRRICPEESDLRPISKSYTQLEKALAGLLSPSSLIPAGALVAGTALKPSHLDVLVVLPHDRWPDLEEPHRLLEILANSLSSLEAAVNETKKTIQVRASSESPIVELIPAVTFNVNGNYSNFLVPDRVKNLWIRSDPDRHLEALRSLEPSSIELIRLLKHWNRQNGNLLESFHIESVVLKYGKLAQNWPRDLFEFFSDLIISLCGPLYHPMDAAGRVDHYLDQETRDLLRKKIQEARQITKEAWFKSLNIPDSPVILEHYTELFGPTFANKPSDNSLPA
jgi:hypothetical protein